MARFLRWLPVVLLLVAAGVAVACTAQAPSRSQLGPENQPWRLKDPAVDRLPADVAQAAAITLGANIFTQTQVYAPSYAGNLLQCASCHLASGQRAGAIPLVGVTTRYPKEDPRSGSVIDLEQRIESCFLRSLNGTPPPRDSQEMRALVAWMGWISDGVSRQQADAWDGVRHIPQDQVLPIGRLSVSRGQNGFRTYCIGCHMVDGQGTGTTSLPPLWGPQSWNDGAGLSRVYTLAGFIQGAMPINQPGSLSWEEAQHIAAYLLAQPRPVYGGKAQDYPAGPPVDAVSYPQRYPVNPLTGQPNVD